jgi:hypothetical protein
VLLQPLPLAAILGVGVRFRCIRVSGAEVVVGVPLGGKVGGVSELMEEKSKSQERSAVSSSLAVVAKLWSRCKRRRRRQTRGTAWMEYRNNCNGDGAATSCPREAASTGDSGGSAAASTGSREVTSMSDNGGVAAAGVGIHGRGGIIWLRPGSAARTTGGGGHGSERRWGVVGSGLSE